MEFSNINSNLEKMIRKSTKILRSKQIDLEKRNNRKLRIKKKKFFPKVKENENDNEM